MEGPKSAGFRQAKRQALLASSASAPGVTMILDVSHGDYSITIRSFAPAVPSDFSTSSQVPPSAKMKPR